LNTATTKLGTGTPSRPTRELAINGASKGVAGGGRRHSATSDTTVRGSVYHRTRLGLGTSGARFGASTVARPTGKFAIDGACERVAGGGRRKSGTDDATVGNISHDRTRLGLRASTTGLGAGTKARPGRNHTVDGASESVASNRGGEARAYHPTMRYISYYGARLGLGTSAAGLGACAIARPGRHLAINWACKSIAVGGGGKTRAYDTSISYVSYDRTRLGFGTSATRLGALRVVSPSRHLAVNRASLSVTDTVLASGAVVTTVLGSDIDLVRTRLFATATTRGAGGPGVPGVLTVNGSRVGVAILFNTGGVTRLATMRSICDDRARTAFDATTAKL